VIILTHEHKDHVNITTLKKLSKERPTLRFGCCEWMVEHIKGHVKNIDVYKIGDVYNYGSFSISPIKLYHDVPNCGYRIFKNDSKILHATDTSHLEGITAKDYDLYAIEHNYDEEKIAENIREKEGKGLFCYEKRAMNSHLSEQQAREFIYKNKKESSEVLRLHQSDNNS